MRLAGFSTVVNFKNVRGQHPPRDGLRTLGRSAVLTATSHCVTREPLLRNETTAARAFEWNGGRVLVIDARRFVHSPPQAGITYLESSAGRLNCLPQGRGVNVVVARHSDDAEAMIYKYMWRYIHLSGGDV